MNNIIFCDIDGVFNISTYINKLVRENKKTSDNYGSLFNPECVENFNEVIDKTGADIVISSTWRLSGLKIMQEMWKARGLKGNVIGITPIGEPFQYMSRGEEIESWLMKNGRPEKIVILDDNSIGNLFKSSFIKCDPKTGITEEIKNIMIYML